MAEIVGYIVVVENGKQIDKPVYDFSEFSKVGKTPRSINKDGLKKKKISGKRRRLLSENPYCQYCRIYLNENNSTMDHVYPRSKGGSSSLDNLVLACVSCNQKKADLLPLQFIKLLVDY